MNFLKKAGAMVGLNLFGWFVVIVFTLLAVTESGLLEKRFESIQAESRNTVRIDTHFRGKYRVTGTAVVDLYAFYCTSFEINGVSSTKGSEEERVLRCLTLEVLTLKEVNEFRLKTLSVSTSPTVVLSSKESFTVNYIPDPWEWLTWTALFLWGLFVINACAALNWFFGKL